MQKIFQFFMFMLFVGSIDAYADQLIKTLNTDQRAKVARYSPTAIYSIKTNYFISTDIIFSEDEILNPDDYHLGDASSWDVQVARNHLYIKAKKMDAGGNLNVTTDKRTYHFVLSVAEENASQQTLFLKFSYPYEPERKAIYQVKLPPDLCEDKNKYNLLYSFTGDKEQAPIKACDDGTFTYFKFRKNTDLPAVFMVLPDRREEVVNYHMENGYLVVERVAKAFTLRNAQIVTSVYNDRALCDWSKVNKGGCK